MQNSIKSKVGFTLIEILIAVGILAIIGGFALFMSMDFYRSYNMDSEVATVVTVLNQARSRAMSNIGEQPHGVYIDDEQYILFHGSEYDPGEVDTYETYERSPAFDITDENGVEIDEFEVVFSQLEGGIAEVDPLGGFGLQGQGRLVKIELNDAGRINW